MASKYEDIKKRYLKLSTASAGSRSGLQEEIRTTPLFSLAVQYAVNDSTTGNKSSDSDNGWAGVSSDDESSGSDEEKEAVGNPTILPQYGLLGFNIGGDADTIEQWEPILMNIDAPNSAFVCGSQGAGKSYTVSTMLENMLIPNEAYGKLHAPTAGVVFHYDGNASEYPAEAASLCSSGVKVRAFVSKSHYAKLKPKYEQLAGSQGNISVERLLLRSSDLNAERILKLMAFDEKEGHQPLYMEVLLRVLREMSEYKPSRKPKPFDYMTFKNKLLSECGFTEKQNGPLNLRLSILESFLDLDGQAQSSSFALEPGTLTIVDMSDTFVNASTCCALFNICLGIIQQKATAGLTVVVDEAHKYMNSSSAAEDFTERLLTTIREQRHNGTRVIIATQEPTISEKLLDLCSTTIVHRFSSPAWFDSIKKHLAGAGRGSSHGDDARGPELFDRIASLNTGESLVFSPSSFLLLQDGKPQKVLTKVIKMKTRARLTKDTGSSLLASEQASGDALELDCP